MKQWKRRLKIVRKESEKREEEDESELDKSSKKEVIE